MGAGPDHHPTNVYNFLTAEGEAYGVLVNVLTTSSLSGENFNSNTEKSLIYSICQYLWCKYLYCGRHQGPN